MNFLGSTLRRSQPTAAVGDTLDDASSKSPSLARLRAFSQSVHGEYVPTDGGHQQQTKCNHIGLLLFVLKTKEQTDSNNARRAQTIFSGSPTRGTACCVDAPYIERTLVFTL